MRDYVAVVFDDMNKAYEGLHEIWALDGEGMITVHGTAVVHRTEWGQYQVDTKETHPALATAVGVGVGALIGALAGPAGAAVGAAKGAGIGAATGAAVGGGTDLYRAGTRDQASLETSSVIRAGQSAVIADVSEDSTALIDARMKALGGSVYRRSRSGLNDDAWYSFDLYPYEYIPPPNPEP